MRATTTLGELRGTMKALEDLPDHYRILVNSPEMDLDDAVIGFVVAEGDTSDGPGTVVLEIQENE